MHKSAKSPLSSASDSNIPKTPSQEDGERNSPVKSPKKTFPTTDKPIIAVIKAQEDMDSPEEMDEENDCVIEPSNISLFSLPAPFKSLPSVSVCLKQEDRIPFARELKGIKRSPSTGSNSSTGSSEAQKAGVNVLQKRRKVEKPAPIVIGRENDCYCWVCHRENIVLCCIACPRAYHSRCAGEMSGVSPDWVCPECQKILAAENVDSRSSTLAEISLDKLGALLKLSLNKVKSRAPLAFHQPVSLEHYPMYLHYVIHPMDLSLLEKSIKQKLYGCTEAFLADVKWIAHNSCVFNGPQHPLSTNAKNLVKSCDQDMQEIEICPDCFVHSVVRAKYWFSEVCRKPHPLVWAKLKGFPYWPAKVVRILDGNVDARFFGAHDRAWVPVSQCYHLSKEMPTSSKPKKKGNYEVALEELNVHVHLLIQKFKCFEYAPYRSLFNSENKFLMYHGIDLEKASKEDIVFDANASPSNMRFPSPEKENRFAKYMESQSEKMCVDEEKLDESLPTDAKAKISQTEEENSFSFLFKERSVSSSSKNSIELTKKIVQENSLDEEKVDSVEKKNDTTNTSAQKKTEAISDSEQLRKLELALERIKGIVAVNADLDKEADEKDVEVNEEKIEIESECLSETLKDDAKEKTKPVSPLFKSAFTLPVYEKIDEPERNEYINTALETNKKTDSFFLKLNETIESCKAKLGISEITDDLSDDDSGADENASGSDEDEGEDSSASEADEENSSSSEEAENAEEETGNAEASDEEVENGIDNEVDKGEESSEARENGGSNYESEDQSSSESISSGTDIEAGSSNKGSPKKPEKSTENNIDYEDSVQEVSESNEDIQMPEVSVDESCAVEGDEDSSASKENADRSEGGENTVSLSNLGKDSLQKLQSENAFPHGVSDVMHEMVNNSHSKADDDSNSNEAIDNSNRIENNLSSVILNVGNKPINLNNFSPTKNVSALQRDIIEDLTDDKEHDGFVEQNTLNNLSENIPINSVPSKDDQDDDEVIICNSPKANTPPVIVLDDDQENSVSDTFAIKTSPHSSSVESLVLDEHDGSSPRKNRVMNGGISNRTLSEESKLRTRCSKRIMGKKRVWNFDSSDDDDDDIQIVTPVKGSKQLTGAIRTFNKPDSNRLTPVTPSTPSQESSEGNLGKENFSPMNVTFFTPDKSKDSSDFPISPPRISLQSPIIDTSDLSEKDKEILLIKRKMSCVFRAYRIQTWKCKQEREELRHNMNLIIMEMRACLEADKKQAIEALSKTFKQEKLKCIEETKTKQWCASCLMESRYACCWNTSYCSISCQKHHFPIHRTVCTQIKSKGYSDLVERKSKAATNSTDGSENKNSKVIIVNMKPSEAAKGVSSSAEMPTAVSSHQAIAPKPQIQLLAAKNPMHLSSTPCTSSPIQFYIAPMKSTPVPSSAPLKLSNEHAKPSTSLSVPVIITTAAAKAPISTPTSSVSIKMKSSTLTSSSVATPSSTSSSAATTPSSTSTSSSVATTPSLTSTPLSVATTIQPSSLTLASSPTVTSTSSSKSKEVIQEQNLDATQINKDMRSRNCDLSTALNLLKKKNLEYRSLLKNNVEQKKRHGLNDQSQPKEETNLEEIYFPSPPRITFEGYDSVSPESNLVIDEIEGIKDSDSESSDKGEDVTPEQDVILSDDEVDNEMVNIGRGIEIKAKFLNKCLVYGLNAKKLTRCLVDVIFPDIKLLATCSAFGQKSNVTKLTRAALPARKVYSIIDFVGKRFQQATRSEIVLAINMKCKEARIILNRLNTESKTTHVMERKSWTKEDQKKPSSTTVPSTTITTLTTPSMPVTTKIIPNLVCVKSSGLLQTSRITGLSLQKKSTTGQNMFHRSSQILIRPKPASNTVGSATLVSTPSAAIPVRRRETVKELLKDKLQLSASTTPIATVPSESQRPLIILGSAVTPVRQIAPVQNPTAAVSSTIKK